MFVILNVAVGGNWPGKVAPYTVSDMAASMDVQYVELFMISRGFSHVEYKVQIVLLT